MPTTTTYEYKDTDLSATCAELTGESSVEKTRMIWRRDGARLDITVEEKLLISEGVLPVQNDPYVTTVPSGMTWVATTKYRGHSVVYASDKFTVIVRMRWSTLYVIDPATATSGGAWDGALPCQTEYVARTRMAKVYRTGWTVNPPAGSDTSADMGGTATAGGFQGVDFLVGQVQLRMRFTQDSSVVPMDSAAASLTTYIGTRNSAIFAGFAVGSLICEGVSVSKLSSGTEYYEVIFEFLFDRWFHHEQIPTMAQDGRPQIGMTGPSEVKWKRLPRTSVDFNNIYAGDARLQQLVEDGWW